MSENTPLLQDAQNGSTSSSNASGGINVNSPTFGISRELAWIEDQKRAIRRPFEIDNIKERLAFSCDTSITGRIWEFFDAILSAMFVTLYIWNTRYVTPDSSKEEFPFILQTADFVLAITIFVQYIPHLWLDINPFQYTFNSFSFLTWLSVFPVMIAYVLVIFCDSMKYTYMGAGILIYLYPVRFWRLLRSVQIVLIPVKSSLFNVTKITRKGIKLGTAIFFAYLTVTAIVHLFTFKRSNDINVEDISFLDTFYYTVLSSTNGLSTELVPDSVITRTAILCLMILGARYIPGALDELLSLIKKRSNYINPYKFGEYKRHIIVTGDFDSTSLFEFLREFFCPDHGFETMNTCVVIMHPNEPNERIVDFLEDPAFVNRVQYIKGTPTWRYDLEKIRADKACEAFILTKKFSNSGNEDDATQIMRALAMNEYNPQLLLHVQVNLPENVPYFDFLAKDVVCNNELTMGLMAQSLVVPGFASLVVSLTTSITNSTVQNLISNAKKADLNWAAEYVYGIKHEVYAVTFPSTFIGKTFLECSDLIYTRLRAVLFSIGIYRVVKGCSTNSRYGSETSPFQIFLNPRNYVIKGTEIGFVISDSAKIINEVATCNEHSKRLYDPFASVSHIAKSAHQAFGKGSNSNSTPSKLDRTVPLFPLIQVKIGNDDENNLSDLKGVVRKNVRKVAANVAGSEDSKDFEDSEIKNIYDHLVICDSSNNFPENLDIFISVLREKNSACRNMPVVILSNGEPNDSHRDALKKFGQVYIVKGSPLRREDLFRAGVEHAKKCVVLSDSSNYENKLIGTADAASIMIALIIESLTSDCFVLVECVRRETFKMIGKSRSVVSKEEEHIQALMRPSFMAGNVFTSCNLDTMFCQSFYNKYILLIIKCLIFSHDIDDDMISSKIGRRLNEEWKDLRVDSGHLFCVDVPSFIIGNTYDELYGYLIKYHQAVPLGLYRSVTYDSSPQNYIYVNPVHNTIVKNDDKIYLIASKLPNFVDNTVIIGDDDETN